MAGEVSCLWCRTEEPSGFLLGINHGGEHGIHWGICCAQSLTRNHVAYHVGRLTLGARANLEKTTGNPMRYVESRCQWQFPDGAPVTPSNSHLVDHDGRIPLSAAGRDAERENLRHSVARADQLWAHRDDTDWLEEARVLLADLDRRAQPPSDHVALADSEQDALW